MVRGLSIVLPLTMLLGLLLLPTRAAASGVGVTPGSLELETSPLVKATGSIVVINTSSEEGLYQVYIEGETAEWLSISPEEFVLEASGSQVVEITVSPPLTAVGEHEVEVCVVSLVCTLELKVGCGVKVPLRIIILPPSPVGMVAGYSAESLLLWIVIAVVAAIIIPVAVRRRRKAREA